MQMQLFLSKAQGGESLTAADLLDIHKDLGITVST